MVPPRQPSMFQGQGGVCPGHDQFEARMDDKFETLRETMERAVTEMTGVRQDLAAINKALSDGRVEFVMHEGRLAALEKTTGQCESDRTLIRGELKNLQKAYWLLVGGFTVLQLVIQVALKIWKI